jgi:DNA repair exonuclease SbcCD ATPase subunit
MVSSSKMTTIYEAQYSVSKEIAEASDIDTIASSLESFAEEVRGVGQEYQESADNQREYFPDSSVADDNEEKAQQLDSWADELSDTADTIRSEFSDVEVLQSELDELDDTKEDYASESDRLSDEIEDRLEEARSRVEDAIGECPL